MNGVQLHLMQPNLLTESSGWEPNLVFIYIGGLLYVVSVVPS